MCLISAAGRGGRKCQACATVSAPTQAADNSHQPTSKLARRKPLQILEKYHKPSQKQPVKMEGDQTSRELAQEQVGLLVVKENKCSPVCSNWWRWRTTRVPLK